MYCRIIPSQHGSNYGIAWHSTSFWGAHLNSRMNSGVQVCAPLNQPLAPVAAMKCNAAVPIILLLLLVGSGCAALIYEIVWFQLLQLVIGSSAVSLGVLLGTFMGGMCLGSLFLARVISRTYHPLRVYALLELTIGVIGLAILFAMPLVASAYTVWAGSGF